MEGHLYQRGKSKIWYLLYDVPPAPGAKRDLRSVRIGKMSKSEADARKRDILSRTDKGAAGERSVATTVEEFLASWLDNTRDRLQARTAERYASIARLHVVPIIGNVKLSKIAPDHLRRIYRAVLDKGLSNRTCLHVHRMLYTALQYAVREERVLSENVATRVKAPRPPDREAAPMSREQIRFLIEATKGTRLEMPVALTAVTGLRRGELLALRWRFTDMAKGALFVAESLEHSRDKTQRLRFKGPKSRTSRRIIPLAPESIEQLRTHKAQQDAEKGQSGKGYSDNDLVFPNPGGEPWPPDTFSAQFAKLARTVGMQGFRFHDLRHAFASLTLADGVSIKEVQTLMGHSSPTITLSVYARSMEGLGRQAINDLARSLLAS